MLGHDIIVVGTSAGGVEALMQMVEEFPPDLPAAVFIVLHIPAQSPTILPSLLEGRSRLPAITPVDRDAFRHGLVYVAPPDHHLLIEAHRFASFGDRGKTFIGRPSTRFSGRRHGRADRGWSVWC